MTNLDSILKHYFVDKDLSSQSYGFSIVMHGCESWTIKKAEPEKLMPSNSGAGEDSLKSLGQQGDQTSQSYRKSKLNTQWKD